MGHKLHKCMYNKHYLHMTSAIALCVASMQIAFVAYIIGNIQFQILMCSSGHRAKIVIGQEPKSPNSIYFQTKNLNVGLSYASPFASVSNSLVVVSFESHIKKIIVNISKQIVTRQLRLLSQSCIQLYIYISVLWVKTL